MKKNAVGIILGAIIAMAFGVQISWTASQVFLTVDNISAGSGITLNKTSTTVEVVATAVGISDGDKGDITVSSSGAAWAVDNAAITYAKIQDVSAASKLLGRGSASGSGDTEEITIGTGLTMSGTTISSNSAVNPASCTVGGGTNSWLCGTSALAAGLRATAIGDSASAPMADSLAVGRSAVAGTGSQTNNIAIGASATSTGNQSIAIGKSASSTNSSSVVIGTSATDNGNAESTVIGFGAAGLDGSVVIGSGATVSGSTSSIAIGEDSLAQVAHSIAIGRSARASGGGAGGPIAIGENADAIGIPSSIAIGKNSSAGHASSIALGISATTAATGDLIIGSETGPIVSAYVGEGVTSTTPGSLLFSGSGGSGSNIAGGNMTLRAGLATGNAATGDVVVAGADAVASGTTLQTAANRWLFKGGTGHLITGSDNAYDIGASGATRPRTMYLGTSLTTPAITISGGTLGAGKILTDSAGDGIGTWQAPAAASLTVGTTTATSGTVGSVLFVATGPILQQDNTNFFWDDSANRLGITTAAPEFDIALGGNIARTIGLNRRTSGSVVNPITIRGSDAISGNSNAHGGDVVLTPGLPTGTGVSAVVAKGITQNAASASGDGITGWTRQIIGMSKYTEDAVDTVIATLAGGGSDGLAGGGIITYAVTVTADTGTPDARQVETGILRYEVLNDAAGLVTHSAITKVSSAQQLSTGSLTVAFSIETDGDIVVNSNTSLGSLNSGYPRIDYTIDTFGNATASHR